MTLGNARRDSVKCYAKIQPRDMMADSLPNALTSVQRTPGHGFRLQGELLSGSGSNSFHERTCVLNSVYRSRCFGRIPLTTGTAEADLHRDRSRTISKFSTRQCADRELRLFHREWLGLSSKFAHPAVQSMPTRSICPTSQSRRLLSSQNATCRVLLQTSQSTPKPQA